jgi:hypothetical protein
MKNILITVYAIAFLMVTQTSCEKDINLPLNTTSQIIVVDATIENNKPPIVVLSKSLGYFSKITPELLASSFVHKAKISISDGVKTHILAEDSIPTGNGTFGYFYTNNPKDPSTAIFGKLSTSYTLQIIEGNNTYTSNTTIPNTTRRLDSIWWEKAPGLFGDSGYTNMIIKATDKPGYGDYIRYFTKANSNLFYPGFNSVFDDNLIDGTTYIVPVSRGVDRNRNTIPSDSYFKKGDTATIKLCNIDKANFDFWQTFEYTARSIGNPFSSPTSVTGNISNGALGYFGGYAVQYKTIIMR